MIVTLRSLLMEKKWLQKKLKKAWFSFFVTVTNNLSKKSKNKQKSKIIDRSKTGAVWAKRRVQDIAIRLGQKIGTKRPSLLPQVPTMEIDFWCIDFK